MQRRKFARKFEIEAVRVVRERGVSVAQAAPTSTFTRRCCIAG